MLSSVLKGVVFQLKDEEMSILLTFNFLENANGLDRIKDKRSL